MAFRTVDTFNPSYANKALGITLPFNGPAGLFSSTYTTQQQAVSNLKNLLLTAKGERIQQPKFGTDLIRLLFEPNTDLIKQNVDDVIKSAVNRWLPYINIVEIKTVTAEEDPSLNYNISVTISFTVLYNLKEDSLTSITLNMSETQLTITDSTTNGN